MIALSFRQTPQEFMVRVAATIIFKALQRAGCTEVELSALTEKPQYGFTASASPEPLGPKFVRITDLQDGSIAWKHVPYCECDQPDAYRLKPNDLLFARTGATTGKTLLVTDTEDAIFASYLIRVRPKGGVLPAYLYAFFQSDSYWAQIIDEKEGSAQPNCNGAKLAAILIPSVEGTLQAAIGEFLQVVRARQQGDSAPLPDLPAPLTDVRRIVAKIDHLAAKIEEARITGIENDAEADRLIMSAFRQITKDAPVMRLRDIAPLERRPAAINPLQDYPGVSVRSFGRGTFHNPPLLGSELTWEKPHLVKAGDILISNIKAWEGAIAVARSEDDGRYGSHRYLTCVPVPEVATARFVCFYLLAPEGLGFVGEASPGSADRNRTLSAKALLEIPVPVPAFKRQLWFGQLCERVDEIKQCRQDTAAELDALLPSILDKAFNGEL